jgi:hypothetical protein
MSPEGRCSEVRELLPELALGTATGEERAAALEHLAVCGPCRKALSELTEVADGLLLLAPTREPPVGFESRVVTRLRGEGRDRRWARRLAVAAVALVLAAGSAAAALFATRSDRELGAAYRRTLEVANGDYFTAARLHDRRRAAVGHVFGYEGSPSWLFVLLRDGVPATYRVTVAMEDGRRRAVGRMTVRGGAESWATILPMQVHDVAGVRLRGAGRLLVAKI